METTKRDSIHYSFESLDGYGKAFNFVVSPRGDGKTTAFNLTKSWPAYRRTGLPTVLLRRRIVDFSRPYIESLALSVRKFTGEKTALLYRNSEKSEGIFYIYPDSFKNPPIYIGIAMSKDVSSFKALVIKAAYIFMDEFICDPRAGERYERMEARKLRELYSTAMRENPRIRCYFCGNPYSLYNPYFVDFGIDPMRLVKGKIVAGKEWAVDRHAMNPELHAWYVANNRSFDEENPDAYTKFALEGDAINDMNANVRRVQPPNHRLQIVFRLGERTYGCYRNEDFLDRESRWWIGEAREVASWRTQFVLDWADLAEGTRIYSREESFRLQDLKLSMRSRSCSYDSIATAHMMEEVYKSL